VPSPASPCDDLLVVDGHIDVPHRLWRYREDLSTTTEGGDFDAPRARAGGLDAAFLAAYTPTDLQDTPGASRERADALIDIVDAVAEAHPSVFARAETPAEVRAAAGDGRIALPMGLENGAALEGDLDALRHFYDRGIRYVTLTHGAHNGLGDSSYDDAPPRWGGLSPFGRDAVAAMNDLGMMVDVSHVTDATAEDAIAASDAPVVATHSSCRHFTPGWERNVSDALIRAIADTGGTVGIAFGPSFLRGEYRAAYNDIKAGLKATRASNGWDYASREAVVHARRVREDKPMGTVAEVADHVDRVADLVGIDHVALGSDFDGVRALPKGLQDVSGYPALARELADRGYSDDALAKVFGENLLRVWAAVETT
jgi:membrane dipeptidase